MVIVRGADTASILMRIFRAAFIGCQPPVAGRTVSAIAPKQTHVIKALSGCTGDVPMHLNVLPAADAARG